MRESLKKVVHTYCGLPLSKRMEQTIDALNNLHGSQGNYSERTKSIENIHRVYTVYTHTHIPFTHNILEMTKLIRKNG